MPVSEKLLAGVYSIAWCNGLEDAVVRRIARIMSCPIPHGCKPASILDVDRRRNILIRFARHATFLVNLSAGPTPMVPQMSGNTMTK